MNNWDRNTFDSPTIMPRSYTNTMTTNSLNMTMSRTSPTKNNIFHNDLQSVIKHEHGHTDKYHDHIHTHSNPNTIDDDDSEDIDLLSDSSKQYKYFSLSSIIGNGDQHQREQRQNHENNIQFTKYGDYRSHSYLDINTNFSINDNDSIVSKPSNIANNDMYHQNNTHNSTSSITTVSAPSLYSDSFIMHQSYQTPHYKQRKRRKTSSSTSTQHTEETILASDLKYTTNSILSPSIQTPTRCSSVTNTNTNTTSNDSCFSSTNPFSTDSPFSTLYDDDEQQDQNEYEEDDKQKALLAFKYSFIEALELEDSRNINRNISIPYIAEYIINKMKSAQSGVFLSYFQMLLMIKNNKNEYRTKMLKKEKFDFDNVFLDAVMNGYQTLGYKHVLIEDLYLVDIEEGFELTQIRKEAIKYFNDTITAIWG